MKSEELSTLKNLQRALVLDVLGEWVCVPNAKTATRSMVGVILEDRAIYKHRGPRNWDRVFDYIIAPNHQNVVWFTFVRNPWDRCVSAFLYMQQTNQRQHHIDKNVKFDDYILNTISQTKGMHNSHWYPQHLSFTCNDKINKEIFIGRFESLYEDWKYIANILKVNPVLPWVGKIEHKDYRTYYNQQTIDVIADVYSKDIELLGYTFE